MPIDLGISTLDLIIFFGFIIFVVLFGTWMGRTKKEEGAIEDSESYFLAGRGLSWWLIGFSLIAANISTEQFVGMSGSAANRTIGLAVASYEWCAAIALVLVAFFFLPKFLKSGIFTIPQFLEHRYNPAARLLMSLSMVVIFVFVTTTSVIYSGAKFLEPQFTDINSVMGIPLNIMTYSWAIGLIAMIYVLIGGLKSCAWADLIQGSALIIGGIIIMFLAFGMLADAPPQDIGLGLEHAEKPVLEKFQELNSGQLHMALDDFNGFLPWTALLFGIWVPNFYYWGLNQYIVQRTLGAGSLREGQKGIVFAAGMKLIIPFIVCIPGIMAYNLFSGDMQANTENPINAAGKIQTQTLDAFTIATLPKEAGVAIPMETVFVKNNPEEAANVYKHNFELAKKFLPGITDRKETESIQLANARLISELQRSEKFKESDGIIAQYATFAHTNNQLAATQAKEKSIFPFNKDFATLYPAKATEIYLYNCQVGNEVLKAEGFKNLGLKELPPLPVLVEQPKDAKFTKETEAVVNAHNTKLGVFVTQLTNQNGTVLTALENATTFTGTKESELIGYDHDSAFGLLVTRLVKDAKEHPGLYGFILAALFGAIMSSVASMLNATSTIFTMDLYNGVVNKTATQSHLVWVGRICILVCVAVSCYLAPLLASPQFKGIFHFIQEFQGFISPGILVIFLFALFVKRAPRICGVLGLLLSPAIYGFLMVFGQKWQMPLGQYTFSFECFLNRMALTVLALIVILGIVTIIKPLKKPVEMPKIVDTYDLSSSKGAMLAGAAIIAATVGLYLIFW